MADNDKALLVAAAVKAMVGAEPVNGSRDDHAEYNAAMHAATLEVLDAASEYGFIGTLLARLDETDTFVVDEVVEVKLEKNSQRILITCSTHDRKTGEEKLEELRTNRIDDWRYGSAARALGHKAKSLIGQRASITKRLEEMTNGSGRKVRIIENMRGLGKKRDED